MRQSILIDGVHHARELTTISMVVYLMLSTLREYEQGDLHKKALLRDYALIFIPIFNVDGVYEIDRAFE